MKKGTQQTNQHQKPKVAVVVGSGGIKPISSIPLFEFLEEAKIDVDLLVGCSGGSIFTGWWATCNSASLMRNTVRKHWTRELFTKPDYRTLLSIAGLPFGRFDKTRGLLKPENAHKTYYRMYGDQMMEDLSMRTIFQATDLLSGKPIFLDSGLVRNAVYASAAVFPIFPPVCINDQWLIDGAYSSPLPILKAVNENMDVIIVMTMEERSAKESTGFVSYLMRSIGYQTEWLTRNQLALSVDLHHHEIIIINVLFDRVISFRSVDSIPEILEKGKAAVDQKKDEILSAIANYAPGEQMGNSK